jgi:hypothetical protein
MVTTLLTAALFLIFAQKSIPRVFHYLAFLLTSPPDVADNHQNSNQDCGLCDYLVIAFSR